MIVIMSIVMTMLASGSPCHYRSSSLGWGRTVRKKTGHRACFWSVWPCLCARQVIAGGKTCLHFALTHSLTQSLTHSLTLSLSLAISLCPYHRRHRCRRRHDRGRGCGGRSNCNSSINKCGGSSLQW